MTIRLLSISPMRSLTVLLARSVPSLVCFYPATPAWNPIAVDRHLRNTALTADFAAKFEAVICF